jgi:hypothetical protein
MFNLQAEALLARHGRPEALLAQRSIKILRLDTNSALAEALELYRRTGWSEIDRFNDDPYPDRFFEKRL